MPQAPVQYALTAHVFIAKYCVACGCNASQPRQHAVIQQAFYGTNHAIVVVHGYEERDCAVQGEPQNHARSNFGTGNHSASAANTSGRHWLGQLQGADRPGQRHRPPHAAKDCTETQCVPNQPLEIAAGDDQMVSRVTMAEHCIFEKHCQEVRTQGNPSLAAHCAPLGMNIHLSHKNFANGIKSSIKENWRGN